MKAENSNIEKTLNSLDGFKRPQTSALLYDKILKGLEATEAKIVSMSPAQTWSMAAGIALLILLNVYTVKHSADSNKKTSPETNAFAQEYFPNLNNQY